MAEAGPLAAPLSQTPLHALHVARGARLVPFAGYAMPVSYPAGILAEHRQCRESAALFDVSHMGQLRLEGADAAAALETLVPVDIVGLAPGKQRYALFTDDAGGIRDDLMATRRDDHLFLVVNASNKAADVAWLNERIGARCAVVPMPDHALLALQGPKAAAAMRRLSPALAELTFMSGAAAAIGGIDVFATRSGYTGEDGFEISVAAADAEALATLLLEQPEVEPAGLGARDTLRLEAGLCLHGHDIDRSTTPIEAGLAWAIQKVRRAGGARAGRYPGADVIDRQLAEGPPRKRVGLVGAGRAPVREGAEMVAAAPSEGTAAAAMSGRDDDRPAALSVTPAAALAIAPIGRVTSGTLAPTLGKPVAMAYVDAAHAAPGTPLDALVRGARLPMHVAAMPFVPHRYFRG